MLLPGKEDHILLINPWTYDFAAYDFWAKPLGLLYIAGLLRKNGYRIHFIDCLNIYHPEMEGLSGIKRPTRRTFGSGHFNKEQVKKPPGLEEITRKYSRYGITPEIFREEVKKMPSPAAILVTSIMTYWYPGVILAIEIVKEIYPSVPVILGGIYATLCQGHAR